jgi:hypothetical protein
MTTHVRRWWDLQRIRAATPRGVFALLIGLTLIVSAELNEPASALGLILLAPLIWLGSWWVVGLAGRIWRGLVAGKPPEVQTGRPWQSGSTRQQLREDRNARFFKDRGGILLQRRLWFVATGTPPFRVDPEVHQRMQTEGLDIPQRIAGYRDRIWWWYQDAVYWTNRDELEAADIKALLFARERQRQRELDHAHAVMAAAADPMPARKREPIPRDVKLAVWQRDEGKCTECGSNFDLQYDHVIPFAMGGANTPDNLQLLCGRCNQRKGGRL